MRTKLLLRPSVVAALGLIAGFSVARSSGRREAGGVVFAVAGGWCARQWLRGMGRNRGAGMVGLYAGAMGASHPLAKRIGAWPSVLGVSALVAGASEMGGRLARR